MEKTGPKPTERRKYIRLFTPVGVVYITPDDGRIHKADIKDISAEGIRLETGSDSLNKTDNIELMLNIPSAANPIHD